jgi:hypothetical protein
VIYKHKNRHRLDGICSNYQGHEKPFEQRLKERFKFNFQTRIKTRVCDLKNKNTKTKNKATRCARQMWFLFYYVNICKYEHDTNMTRLWCKIVPKTNVKHIKGNEGSYFYLYPFRDLIQGNF